MALGWRTGVGKDSVARKLVGVAQDAVREALGSHALDGRMIARRISTAYPIKRMVFREAPICPGNEDLLHPAIYEAHPEKKDEAFASGATIRDVWCAVGEAFRLLDPLFWLRKTSIAVNDGLARIVVIPDVRKVIEFDYWKARRGLLVNILGLGTKCKSTDVDDDNVKWDLRVVNDRRYRNAEGVSFAAGSIWERGILPRLRGMYEKQIAGDGGES